MTTDINKSVQGIYGGSGTVPSIEYRIPDISEFVPGFKFEFFDPSTGAWLGAKVTPDTSKGYIKAVLQHRDVRVSVRPDRPTTFNKQPTRPVQMTVPYTHPLKGIRLEDFVEGFEFEMYTDGLGWHRYRVVHEMRGLTYRVLEHIKSKKQRPCSEFGIEELIRAGVMRYPTKTNTLTKIKSLFRKGNKKQTPEPTINETECPNCKRLVFYTDKPECPFCESQT